MLAWLAAILFSDDAPRPHRRIIRRRLSLATMKDAVRNIVIIRAAQLSGLQPRQLAPRPSFAPAGFIRAPRVRQFLRIVAGSALRRRLRARTQAEAFTALLSALRDLDALGRQIVKRLSKRLTRVRPLIATRPPHDAVRCLAAPCVAAADSS